MSPAIIQIYLRKQQEQQSRHCSDTSDSTSQAWQAIAHSIRPLRIRQGKGPIEHCTGRAESWQSLLWLLRAGQRAASDEGRDRHTRFPAGQSTQPRQRGGQAGAGSEFGTDTRYGIGLSFDASIGVSVSSPPTCVGAVCGHGAGLVRPVATLSVPIAALPSMLR